MSKGLEALVSLELNACQTSDQKEWAYKTIEKELKEYEMEHTLRIRLENINYELVREKQENEKKLKALEIIKNALTLHVFETLEGKHFLEAIEDCSGISKDNYEILKEVLL